MITPDLLGEDRSAGWLYHELTASFYVVRNAHRLTQLSDCSVKLDERVLIDAPPCRAGLFHMEKRMTRAAFGPSSLEVHALCHSLPSHQKKGLAGFVVLCIRSS